jgi:hypothetical protein
MVTFQVFLRFRKEDYETWLKAREYARTHGLTLGKLVSLALTYYINREDKILEELEEIKALLKSGSVAISKQTAKTSFEQEEPNNGSCTAPSFSYFKDNPWVQILAKRGKE